MNEYEYRTEADLRARLRVGVIGGGVVGAATAASWLEHSAGVAVWDLDERRRTCETPAEAWDSDLLFLCLPTNLAKPTDPGADGYHSSLGLVHLLGAIGELGEWLARNHGNNPAVIIKSTVPVATTALALKRLAEVSGRSQDTLRVFHSPEFLTARCATVAANIPTQVWLGSAEGSEDCPGGNVDRLRFGRTILRSIFNARFPGVACYLTDARTSELAKLALNSFFALKVQAFNVFESVAAHSGADWQDLRALLIGDGRISANHTEVPGPDGLRGFGGACLPKDTHQMLLECHNAGELAGEALFEWVLDSRGGFRDGIQ